MREWKYTQIPKIAHLYWGDSPLPLSRYLTVWSLRKMNPDWDIRVYRPRGGVNTGKVYADEYDGYDYSDKLADVCNVEYVDFGIFSDLWDVHKSDLLRWQLLTDVGGIWSDMDIFYVNSLSLLESYQTTIGPDVELMIYYHPIHLYHSIGLIASSPRNEEITRIRNLAGGSYDSSFQCIGSELLNQSHIDNKYIDIMHPHVCNMIFNQVYYMGAYMIDKIHEENIANKMPPMSVGLHWYAGHPASTEFQNAKSIEDMKGLGSVLSRCVSSVVGNERLDCQ